MMLAGSYVRQQEEWWWAVETTAAPRYNILHASAPSSHKVRKT